MPERNMLVLLVGGGCVSVCLSVSWVYGVVQVLRFRVGLLPGCSAGWGTLLSLCCCSSIWSTFASYMGVL